MLQCTFTSKPHLGCDHFPESSVTDILTHRPVVLSRTVWPRTRETSPSSKLVLLVLPSSVNGNASCQQPMERGLMSKCLTKTSVHQELLLNPVSEIIMFYGLCHWSR